MLQSFSDRIRNSRWLGYVIVGLISIPFALWGIQSYLGGPAADAAAEVNGERIPVYQVQRVASQERQSLRQRFGGELPAGLDERMFRERALEQLIERELLRQAAAEDFRVTDETLRRNIHEQSMFQRDGEFDRELYQRLLSQAGLSPQQYEADVRVGYRIEQLRRGIIDSAFVLDAEARETARLMREERDLAVLVHPRSAAAETVELDEDALRKYYEEHRSAFMTPAQVKAAYLELDLQALRGQVEVTEDELRAEYRANRERYRAREERRAAHILLEVAPDAGPEAEQQALETARDLRERLAEGADFAALAREYSQDPGSAEQGGRLGYITRGSMVEAFEQALYALEQKGAVSEPVRTPYGYHLIKLLDVRAGEGQSFEQVREKLARDLRTRRAERLFYDRVEVLRNTTYEQPGSLVPAAQTTGLEVRYTDWFSRRQGEGIAAEPAVREAAFSAEVREERLNSDLIELGQRRVVVLRIDQERPARPKPFDSVREQVEARLRAERTDAILQSWAEQALARLDAGATPAELATGPVALREPGWLSRSSDDVDVEPAVQRTAFELPAPAPGASTYAATALEEGDHAVVVVRATRLPEVDSGAVAGARERRRQAVLSGEFSAYLGALRNDADIVRNEAALTR